MTNLADLSLPDHLRLALRSYRGQLVRHDVPVPAGIDALDHILTELSALERPREGSGRVTDRPAGHADHDEAGWLSVKAAAHHTGLSESTIKRALSSGALASVRVGRSRRIHHDALTTYMTTTRS